MPRFFRSFEPRILALVAGIVGVLWFFFALGGEVTEGETLAIDHRLLFALRAPGHLQEPIGSHAFQEAMRDVTALGGFTFVTLVTVLAVTAFLLHGKRLHALVMAGAALTAQLAGGRLKDFYDRPRPDVVPHGVYVYSASFPSGHSLESAVTFLTLAMLISSLETRRATKVLAFAVAVLVMLAVGLSRVYLGVHWPSDVLGGWCVGAAVALAAWMALLALGGRPARTRG